MIRFIKRRRAIRGYVWKLSQELVRHFEKKRYYTVDQVSQVARLSGMELSFVVYAHAIFCGRADFDAHYGPLHLRCTYDGLRAVVSRRYFGGVSDFDAASIIEFAKKAEKDSFYESRIGEDAG